MKFVKERGLFTGEEVSEGDTQEAGRREREKKSRGLCMLMGKTVTNGKHEAKCREKDLGRGKGTPALGRLFETPGQTEVIYAGAPT